MLRKILPEYFSRATVPFTTPYRYLTALLAGGLAVLAFAPFGYYPAMILSMALLMQCLANATARQAGWAGWWYGLGLFAPGLQWIYVSLNDFGQLPLIVSFLILGGLFAIMAGYTALACWFCNWITPRHGLLRVLLVFPFSGRVSSSKRDSVGANISARHF